MQNNAASYSVNMVSLADTRQALWPRPVLVYSNPKPARDTEWLSYVRSLAANRVVPQIVATNAEQMWRRLRPLALDIAIPDAAVTDSGTLFISWDRGVHHLEIELLPNGRYEWFYRNRDTDNVGGEYNYPASFISRDLMLQFRLVAENG